MTHLKNLTVKALATLSGVSIRTLQYYDDIGLLKAGRTSAGYRIYDQSHVLLLQQILVQKALGLSLEAIKTSLQQPDFDVLAQLKAQKQLLLKRAEDTKAMIAAIDSAIAKAPRMERETPKTIAEIFQGFDPALYEDEAKEKWGETQEYKTSRNRVKSYTPDDWAEIKAEEQQIWRDAAAAMAAGQSPQSDDSGKLAERHRLHIDRWFYGTTEESYANLASLWEMDARFTANIDKYGQGLTLWFAEAVRHKYRVV